MSRSSLFVISGFLLCSANLRAQDVDSGRLVFENRTSGAGVHVTGNRPLSDVVFWSIRTVLSPEAYITMRIEPAFTREAAGRR